ncbi:MAG: hypothetical protein ACI4P3_05535, partial [Candidatus Spyradosoma sp.]
MNIFIGLSDIVNEKEKRKSNSWRGFSKTEIWRPGENRGVPEGKKKRAIPRERGSFPAARAKIEFTRR